MIQIAEAKNVSASIHNAVVIPYSAIVKPPIDAPIPNAIDHPPDPNALAVSSSSSLQIFGRYAYCAGSKIDLAATIAIARKYTDDKLFNKSNCNTINKTKQAARSEQIINPLREYLSANIPVNGVIAAKEKLLVAKTPAIARGELSLDSPAKINNAITVNQSPI
jgi:hypothetical protein